MSDQNQTTERKVPPDIGSSEWLGGVSREMVMLASGFCRGLAERAYFDEREMPRRAA